MKVLVNGGLNVSELDGWWAEAYSSELGWGIGDAREHGDDPLWDAAEAEQLYRTLEDQVIPEFYSRDSRGIPTAWVDRMRKSMSRLTPAFSSNRTVREYTERYYSPAADAFSQRSNDEGQVAQAVGDWQRTLDQHWDRLRFGQLVVTTEADGFLFEVQVYLNDLDPDAVRVELYADSPEGGDPFKQTMRRGEPLAGSGNGFTYSAEVPASRSSTDYTPRIVPYHSAAFVPIEARHILWQR